MHTLIIGAGFSGLHIAMQATQLGSVCATRRSASSLTELNGIGVDTLVVSGLESGSTLDARNTPLSAEFLEQALKVSHLIICSAPRRTEPLDDPVLRLFSHQSVRMPMLEWVGYLSTIGVYGDHGGAWVDESTPCSSVQPRSIMRRAAELGWLALAERHDSALSILRLAGIYGPGRNAVRDAMAGRERVLTKPGQVFNRIHVEDLATATMKAASQRHSGVLNITDNLPVAPEEVVYYAHKLAAKPNPPAVDVDSVELSEMARSFYGESKRVSNKLSKQLLGMEYKYPTYVEGLDSLWEGYKKERKC